MPPTRNTRSTTNRIGLAAKATDVTGAKSPSTPGWQRCAALSHGIGDTPIPPFLVRAAQNRLVAPLALLTEDALEALAKNRALWTTKYDFDDLEGRIAPRRRCHSTCINAWLPWTWATEAIKFETFMSAFTKMVLLVRVTLCADEESQSIVQADADQFVRQLSMRLRRPGNWQWVRPRALSAIDSWRQKIAEAVAWDDNSLAQLEYAQHGPPNGTFGMKFPSTATSLTVTLGPTSSIRRSDSGRRNADFKKAGNRLSSPILIPTKRRGACFVCVPFPHTMVCDATKIASIKKALAMVTLSNPAYFVLRQDGCRVIEDGCVADLEDWDENAWPHFVEICLCGAVFALMLKLLFTQP